MSARPRPLGVVFLVVGSVLSIATTPETVPEPTLRTNERAGVVDLDGSAPDTVTLRVTMSCARPDDHDGSFPLVAWVTLDALATPLDGGPDSAARAEASVSARIGDDTIRADVTYLDADTERLSVVVAELGERCEDAAACEVDVVFDFDADAPVSFAWEASAEGRWPLYRGGPCLLFLSQVEG